MSAQTTSLTPKKPAKKGRKPKESGPSDFCRICACSLAIRLPNGGKTSFISTENLFVEPKREGVTRIKLADVLLDLGITIIEDDLCSSRVCASCASKARSAASGVKFIKNCLARPTEGAESPSRQGDERFKRMSISPHASSVRQKISRVNRSPTKELCEEASSQQPLAKRSISFHCSLIPIDEEIRRLSDLGSRMVANENEPAKSSVKVAILKDGEIQDMKTIRSKEISDLIKNITLRKWTAVAHTVFRLKELQEDLRHFLSVFVAREFALYCAGNNSILKSNSPDEFVAFSNKFVVEECRSWCPLWFASVAGACGVHKSKEKARQATNNIALATATTARFRNRAMSAIATRISTVLLHSGAKSRDFTRLNKLGVCVSHKQSIRHQVLLGEQFDSPVLHWKSAIEEYKETLYLISEIRDRQKVDTSAFAGEMRLDVSAETLSNYKYFSERAFAGLCGAMEQVVGQNWKQSDISEENLLSARDFIRNKCPPSYRYCCWPFATAFFLMCILPI